MAELNDEKKIAEKKKALENAMAHIDKQFGKGAVSRWAWEAFREAG